MKSETEAQVAAVSGAPGSMTPTEAGFARSSWVLHPWILLYVGIAATHYVNPQIDNWMFWNAGTIVLILSEYLPQRRFEFDMLTTPRPAVTRWLLFALTIGALAVLIWQPRHSLVSAFLTIYLLGPFAWINGWIGPRYAKIDPPGMGKSMVYWGGWVGIIMLFELSATALGNITGRHDLYPPVSNYLDVWMNTWLGKAIFAIVWILLGVMLFKLRPKSDSAPETTGGDSE